MKRLIGAVGILALVVVSGCRQPSAPDVATVSNAIKASTKVAITLGMNQLDKKNHELAVQTAQKTQKAVTELVLPYLDGEAIQLTSKVIEEALKEKFFKNLTPEIKDAIVAAAAVLDVYLPLPDAQTKLTADQLTYLKSFFNGVQDGMARFDGSTATVKMGAPTKKASRGWFR